MEETITTEFEAIFEQFSTTHQATTAIIATLVMKVEEEGTQASFSSVESKMAVSSVPERDNCWTLLVADGFSKDTAFSMAHMMPVLIEETLLFLFTPSLTKPFTVAHMSIHFSTSLIDVEMNSSRQNLNGITSRRNG